MILSRRRVGSKKEGEWLSTKTWNHFTTAPTSIKFSCWKRSTCWGTTILFVIFKPSNELVCPWCDVHCGFLALKLNNIFFQLSFVDADKTIFLWLPKFVAVSTFVLFTWLQWLFLFFPAYLQLLCCMIVDCCCWSWHFCSVCMCSVLLLL